MPSYGYAAFHFQRGLPPRPRSVPPAYGTGTGTGAGTGTGTGVGHRCSRPLVMGAFPHAFPLALLPTYIQPPPRRHTYIYPSRLHSPLLSIHCRCLCLPSRRRRPRRAAPRTPAAVPPRATPSILPSTKEGRKRLPACLPGWLATGSSSPLPGPSTTFGAFWWLICDRALGLIRLSNHA